LAADKPGHIGSVFVVEDEPLILLELQQMLAELGWKVSYAASDIDSAIEFARTATFDLAILDVNVRGRASFAVAEILRGRRVPVVLATGYSTDAIINYYPGAIYLQKPYLLADLTMAVQRAVASRDEPVQRTA
jgi:DNA-binding response OmpR family regulator